MTDTRRIRALQDELIRALQDEVLRLRNQMGWLLGEMNNPAVKPDEIKSALFKFTRTAGIRATERAMAMNAAHAERRSAGRDMKSAASGEKDED